MSLLNTIRSLFGFKAEVEQDDQPIDQLEQVIEKGEVLRFELSQIQSEFDEVDTELSLKLKACDKLIEKGSSEGAFNKKVISERLQKITDEFLDKISDYTQQIKQNDQQRTQLEGNILAKAIDLTSRLTEQEQDQVNDIIRTWKETGLIKGEEIKHHTRAIVTALDEIVKGGVGSRGGEVIGYTESGKPIYRKHQQAVAFAKKHNYEIKDIRSTKSGKTNVTYSHNKPEHTANKKHPNGYKYNSTDTFKENFQSYFGDKGKLKHGATNDWTNVTIHSDEKELKKSHEPLAIELAGKGDIIYDSPVEGHYANAIVCKYIKGEKYILFLKRAADKVLEPGKWCLPGGHIDEGETIEQAAIRELKEEANLDATGGYVRGKAKCDDGKWAFYVEISPDSHSLALLDGESENATWMCQEEWIEADLIFDLKDHLVAMETRTQSIREIPDILKKGIDLEKGDSSDLEKSGGFHPGKPSHKYVRREGSPGNYIYYYDSPDTKSKDGKKYREGLYSSSVAPVKSLSTKQLKEHVENTSTEQLKKVAANTDHPYNDAAKRELERRGGDKKGEQVGISKTHDKLNALVKQLKDRVQGWAGTGELAELHAQLADMYNDIEYDKLPSDKQNGIEDYVSNDGYKDHLGYSKTPQESVNRHIKGINKLASKLDERRVKEAVGHYITTWGNFKKSNPRKP